jgi:hypothetical protein
LLCNADDAVVIVVVDDDKDDEDDEDDDDDDEDDNDEDDNAIAAVTVPTTGDIEGRGAVTDGGKEVEAGTGSANKPAPKKLAALG